METFKDKCDKTTLERFAFILSQKDEMINKLHAELAFANEINENKDSEIERLRRDIAQANAMCKSDELIAEMGRLRLAAMTKDRENIFNALQASIAEEVRERMRAEKLEVLIALRATGEEYECRCGSVESIQRYGHSSMCKIHLDGEVCTNQGPHNCKVGEGE